MDVPARTPPFAIADQPVPSGHRSEDHAKPLSQDGQGPGGNMPVFAGSHQLMNHVNLVSCELMRRQTRTRRRIIEFTLLFAIPVVIS